MKKIISFILSIALASSQLYAQTVVSDPTSVAQRLTLALQEMDEMVEQKGKMIEQIEVLKKQFKEAELVRKRVENVSNAIKKGHEIVCIMEEAESMLELDRTIKQTILEQAKAISEESAMMYIEMLVKYADEVSDLVMEAKTAVKDSESLLEEENNNSDAGGHKMTDAERIERLRQIKEDMHNLRIKITSIFNRINSIQIRSNRSDFLHSIY